MTSYLQEAKDLFEYTQFLRRDFHRHPELGFEEVRTAGIVARELDAMGVEVRSGVGKTGVVAHIYGQGTGPTVLLRFDMDALPIQEQTGVEYASQHPGVMHACGHDVHTSVGLTVARLLHQHRHELSGKVRLIFQPAEEGLGGAEAMIREGILENPKPDIAFALHVWNEQPVGWLGAADGPVMAAAETFRIKVIGKGGHGAVPNNAIDPVVAAAQIISAAQTIVSRNVSPLDTAVISVTKLRGGDTFNVIPNDVELQGTIRTFKPEIRRLVMERFQSLVELVAQALDCQAAVTFEPISPAVINQPEAAAFVRETARETLPDVQVHTDFRTMGSEDMALMLQEVPGCYIFIGSANHEKGLDAAHHHPRFDVDEDILPQAVALMASVTARYLKQN